MVENLVAKAQAYSAEYNLNLIRKRNAFRALPEDFVYFHLTTIAGAIDMNVDGSVAAVNYDYVVPAGTQYKTFLFSRINFEIVDTAMQWDRFGGIIGGLTNGLLLQVLDNVNVIRQDYDTTRRPIMTNADFSPLAGIDNPLTAAAGPDAMPIRFSIFKAGRRMTLFPNWRIRVIVQDDLSAITIFRSMIQGILRP